MSLFSLTQVVTVWIQNGTTSTGGKIWNAGVKLPAKVADTSGQTFTNEGKQRSFNSAVYTRTKIEVGSYLIEGDFKGQPEPVNGSKLVVKSIGNVSMSDMNKALI